MFGALKRLLETWTLLPYIGLYVQKISSTRICKQSRCYGLFNLEHWFQRLYIDLNGYDFFVLFLCFSYRYE